MGILSAALLVLSIFMATLKSSLYNKFAKTQKPLIFDIFIFNMLCYTIAGIEIAIMGIGEKISWFTVFCAFLYAAFVFALQVLSISAMNEGSMSLTSLLVMYGMIIPAISGPIFWQEELSLNKIIGIALMMLSLLFMTETESDRKISLKWCVLGALCFITSGSVGVVEKVHQTSAYKGELRSFLVCAFSMMIVFSLLGAVAVRKKAIKSKNRIKSTALFAGATGIIVGVYNQVNLWLSGNVDSMVLYPIANGGALLLTVLVSVFFFKERLTAKNIIGFGVGFVSIIMLSL